MHIGDYGVRETPNHERGKTFVEYRLIIRDEKWRVVTKLHVYDVAFFSVFVADLSRTLKTRRLSRNDIETVFFDIEALRSSSLIPGKLHRKSESMKELSPCPAR